MDALLDSYYNGIQGVLSLWTAVEAPFVCISACTHGGETAGLDVINFLIDEFHIEQKLKRWSLCFLLSNIAAYEKYLSTWDFKGARCVDENMNRCATPENIATGISSEAQRMRELEPLLSKADFHIDIHSTTKSPASMAIYTSKSQSLFGEVINADEHYIDLITLQVGRPLIDICERNGGIGIGLETWRQDDKTAYSNGIDNVLRILVALEMISQDDAAAYLLPKKANKKLRIVDTVVVHDKASFRLQKDFAHREIVKKGEIIAHEKGEPVVAKQDCLIIMPSPIENMYEGEEYCFLAEAS